MKILLTGSSGFFSKEFIKYTSPIKRLKLFCITRKIIKKKNIRYWKLDLSKRNIKKFPQKKNFDLVIHSSFVRTKKNNDIEAVYRNFNITKNLIKILKKNSFKKFINISSASLYPNKDGKFSEKSSVYFSENSDCIYGLSKYFSETTFNSHINEKKIIHLRVGNIIGNDKDNSIISDMKRKLKSINSIEIYGNGERVLNFIHIKSLIKYVFLIFKKIVYGVFNICDYSMSLNEIAQLIKNKYGTNDSKFLFKKQYVKNPRFNLVTNKFFSLIKKHKPKYKELFYEI
jgi:nucleoside-diphosphate-sugar epimerase